MNAASTYRHTQRAPLCWFLYALAGVILAADYLAWNTPAVYGLTIGGVVTSVLAPTFHWLKVEDAGDRLLIAFGPLPLARRSVRYEDIVGVEVGRTTVMEGWGIHNSPRGGWVW